MTILPHNTVSLLRSCVSLRLILTTATSALPVVLSVNVEFHSQRGSECQPPATMLSVNYFFQLHCVSAPISKINVAETKILHRWFCLQRLIFQGKQRIFRVKVVRFSKYHEIVLCCINKHNVLLYDVSGAIIMAC